MDPKRDPWALPLMRGCVCKRSWATLMTAKYWGHLVTAQAQKGGWVWEDLVPPCHSTTTEQ